MYFVDSQGVWGEKWCGQYRSDRTVSDAPASAWVNTPVLRAMSIHVLQSVQKKMSAGTGELPYLVIFIVHGAVPRNLKLDKGFEKVPQPGFEPRKVLLQVE